MDNKLTEMEKEYINGIAHDIRFYEKYKEFVGQVKLIYLQDGPNKAKAFIVSKADFILGLATDELFLDLLTKL